MPVPMPGNVSSGFSQRAIGAGQHRFSKWNPDAGRDALGADTREKPLLRMGFNGETGLVSLLERRGRSAIREETSCAHFIRRDSSTLVL